MTYSSIAEAQEKKTYKMALMILHTAEEPKVEADKTKIKDGTMVTSLKVPTFKWIIVLDGHTAFDSVAALKKFLKGKKGTTLEWAPGCSIIGGEPLGNTKELESFKEFCKENSIEFIVHPSG